MNKRLEKIVAKLIKGERASVRRDQIRKAIEENAFDYFIYRGYDEIYPTEPQRLNANINNIENYWLNDGSMWAKLNDTKTMLEITISHGYSYMELWVSIEDKKEAVITPETSEQKELDYKIKRAIESQAFENVMLEMGYKTLEELDRDKNNKSLIPMYLTRYEEFKNRTKQYEEQLKNDTNFIDNIRQNFFDDLKETAKIKEYEAKIWVTEDKDLTLDELKYKYANDVIATDKYKKLHEEIQDPTITTPSTQQIQNKIIELVPDEAIKNQLYSALKNNDIIGYTYNLRGIPQAIYENYDINDRLFIVINPSKLQAEYVDFYIYSIDAKVNEVYSSDDMQQLKDLYHNNYDEFMQVIKEDGTTHISQYSYEDIQKYFIELFNSDYLKSAITQTTEEPTQTPKTEIVNPAIIADTIQPTKSPKYEQDQQQAYTHTEVYQDSTLTTYDCNQKLYSLYENNLIKPIFTPYELNCIKANNESYLNRISTITSQIDWNKHLMLIDRDLNYLDKLYKLEQRLMDIKESYLVKYHEFKINKPIEKVLKYKDYKDVFFNYIGFNSTDPRYRDDLIKHLLNKDNFEGIKESYIRLKEKSKTQPEVLETEGYKQFDILVNKLEPIFAVHGTIDAWIQEQVV